LFRSIYINVTKLSNGSGGMPIKTIDFIKGHMGGNEIILLHGDQVPKGEEIKLAQKLLNRPNIRGDEAGFFYKPEKGGDLKIKIAEIGVPRFIPMCGGLTQVLGVALFETDFAEHFDVKIKEPVTKIILETDVGFIPLEIENKAGKVERVWTHMKAYVDYCYKLGVQPVRVLEVDAMKVGNYLVVNGDDVKKVYPEVDFEEMNESALRILAKMSSEFYAQLYAPPSDLCLYDLHPEHRGDARAVFPWDIPRGHIEPSCGTGTTVIGIAMVERGEIKVKESVAKGLIECGGKPVIGGPNIAEFRATIKNGKVVDAKFYHNLIEILATGKICL